MKFCKTPDESKKKIFSEYFEKNDAYISFRTQILHNKKYDTILILRKILKYFKILDHPRNASKIDFIVPPKSVLEFKK